MARLAIKVRDVDKKRRVTDVNVHEADQKWRASPFKVRDVDKKRRVTDVNVQDEDPKDAAGH